MTTELVKKLRHYAEEYKNPPYGREICGTKELLSQAASTIEELSAKVAQENMEKLNILKVNELEKAIKTIDVIPATSAEINLWWANRSEQPVRYGKRIKSEIFCEEYVCSECGGACWYYDVNKNVSKSKYCPNCGAKMTEEDTQNE